MNERDELADVLEATDGLDYAAVADLILKSGYRKPRTITTVEEIDALPVGSVVLDRDGAALQLTAWLGWVASNGTTNIAAEELRADCFPAVVLYTPEVSA